MAITSSVNRKHCSDVIISVMSSQITSVSIVCSTVCSSADQRRHQSSTSLAFVRALHWWPVNSHHKGPVTLKMFPFDDVIRSGSQRMIASWTSVSDSKSGHSYNGIGLSMKQASSPWLLMRPGVCIPVNLTCTFMGAPLFFILRGMCICKESH